MKQHHLWSLLVEKGDSSQYKSECHQNVQVFIEPNHKKLRLFLQAQVKHRKNTIHHIREQQASEHNAAEYAMTGCLQATQSDNMADLWDDLSDDVGLRVNRVNMDASWISENGT